MSQKTFDFTRGSKLRAIDDLKLPPTETSPGLLFRLKSLLRCIEGFAGSDSRCWASIEEIARKLGCCRRTTQMMMAEAVRLKLVTTTKRGQHATAFHDIDWSLVLDWSGECPDFPVTHPRQGRKDCIQGRKDCAPGAQRLRARGATVCALPEPEPVKEPERTGSQDSGVFQTERIPVKQSSVFKPLTADDLKDVAVLMSWFTFALTRQNPVVRDCEADRRFVVEAAVKALEKSLTPVKLFGWLILNNKRGHITQKQADKADRMLKAYWRSSPTEAVSDTPVLALECA